MPKEFQEFGLNLWRRTPEILLRQCFEQLCMGLVVEAVFSRSGYLTGVKIVIRQVELGGADLTQQEPITIQGRV